jgi:hypothetical protein
MKLNQKTIAAAASTMSGEQLAGATRSLVALYGAGGIRGRPDREACLAHIAGKINSAL